jgi:hypothetical protein
MTNTVQLKRSNVANAVPSAGNLVAGELAINYSDGNLFYKNSSNVVTVIASNQFVSVSGNITGGNIFATGNVSAFGTVQSGNVIYTNVDGTASQVLTTYGNGVTYWANSTGGGGGNIISNGTSNVAIPSLNGNVEVAVAAVANSVVIGAGSLFVQGPISTPKVINTLALVPNVVNAVMISPLTISAAGNIFVPTDSTLTIFTPT